VLTRDKNLLLKFNGTFVNPNLSFEPPLLEPLLSSKRNEFKFGIQLDVAKSRAPYKNLAAMGRSREYARSDFYRVSEAHFAVLLVYISRLIFQSK